MSAESAQTTAPRVRGNRWWMGGSIALLVSVAAVAAACTTPTGSGARAPSTTRRAPSPTSTEEDLAGPGAPTVHGSVVPPGSGADVGAPACRSGNPLANVYHPNRLRVLQACATVSGVVESVRSEDDGDVHFDLALDPQYTSMLTPANASGQHGWLVAEIVPADEPGCTPGSPPRPASGSYDYGVCTGAGEVPPRIGSHVFVTGPSVIDEDHGGWAEIHPAWAVSTSPPSAAATPAPAPATTTAPAATPVPAPSPAAASCSASVSNPTPGGGGSETVSVTSDVPSSTATATAHYRTTTHTFSFSTDAAGSGSVTFSIGSPTIGYRVEVDVAVGAATCAASFTPQ